jgi:hypothetical protein
LIENAGCAIAQIETAYMKEPQRNTFMYDGSGGEERIARLRAQVEQLALGGHASSIRRGLLHVLDFRKTDE